MEVISGLPFSLIFAVPVIWLFKSDTNRRYWALANLLIATLAYFAPQPYRLWLILPGGIATIWAAAALWIIVINPRSPLFQLLNVPLPSRRELRADIENVKNFEQRAEKYIALTLQLKKIWFKRDALLSGYNTTVIFITTTAIFLFSATGLLFDYFITGYVQTWLTEISNTLDMRAQKASLPPLHLKDFVLQYALSIIYIQSFFTSIAVGAVLRFATKLKHKQNSIVGYLSLFRLGERNIWIVITLGALTLLVQRIPELAPIKGHVVNLAIIYAFLYILHGISITLLFLEVRLMSTSWIFVGLIILSLQFAPVMIFSLLFFLLMGLFDFWLGLRKRTLRPVTDIQ